MIKCAFMYLQKQLFFLFYFPVQNIVPLMALCHWKAYEFLLNCIYIIKINKAHRVLYNIHS